MLHHRDLCSDPNGVNNLGADAARRLLHAYRGLVFIEVSQETTNQYPGGFRVDLRPGLPYRRVKVFLQSVEEIAQALDLQMMSRKYRQAFTRNYRSLMPGDKRHYRVDVLEAGQESHGVLWVNGEKYFLSDQVIADNLKFRNCWFRILNQLRDIQYKLSQKQNQTVDCNNCKLTKIFPIKNLEASSNPSDNELICQYCEINWLACLGPLLIAFDKCWTDFERSYINELIEIERKSRRLIMDCINVDEELRQYELLYHRLITSPEYINLASKQAILIPSLLSENNYFDHYDNGDCMTKDNVLRTSEKHHISSSIEKDDDPKDELHISCQITNVAKKILLTYQELIRVIALLNGTANIKRKGRTDYSFELLEEVLLIIYEGEYQSGIISRVSTSKSLVKPKEKYRWIHDAKECKKSHWSTTLTIQELQGLIALALPLLEDLEGLRHYMNDLSQNPERIDPHLAQNVQLVNALCQLEARWDEAKTFLDNQTVAKSLTKFLGFISQVIHLDHSLYGTTSMSSSEHDLIGSHTCHLKLSDELSSSTCEKNDDMSLIKMSYNKQQYPISEKTVVTEQKETFEEQIAAFDVAAFLALPRLAVLFYISYPFPDSLNQSLLQLLLPDSFKRNQLSAIQSLSILEETNDRQFLSQGDNIFSPNILSSIYMNHTHSIVTHSNAYPVLHYSPHLQSSHTYSNCTTSRSRHQLFQLHQHIINHSYNDCIPQSFQKIIMWGARIGSICEKGRAALQQTPLHSEMCMQTSESSLLEFEDMIMLHIIERCIKTPTDSSHWEGITSLPSLLGLSETVHSFIGALEEASIILQRTHPKEWNGFLHVTVKCLQAYRTWIQPNIPIHSNTNTDTLCERVTTANSTVWSKQFETFTDHGTTETPLRTSWLLEGSPVTGRASQRTHPTAHSLNEMNRFPAY